MTRADLERERERLTDAQRALAHRGVDSYVVGCAAGFVLYAGATRHAISAVEGEGYAVQNGPSFPTVDELADAIAAFEEDFEGELPQRISNHES